MYLHVHFCVFAATSSVYFTEPLVSIRAQTIFAEIISYHTYEENTIQPDKFQDPASI